MKEIGRIKLSEVLKLVSKPRYVLGTTYTLSLAFFESVVFPFISRTDLRSCLILCDTLGYQGALTEGAALQGAAQEYLVVPAPLADCFHPKVWIVIGEAEAVILAGSGNLTQAGFMTNAEFFDAIHISEDNPATPQLLESIREFVGGLAKMWPAADSQHLLCVATLDRIKDALGVLPVAADAKETAQFLHSFHGPLIDQLPVVANPVQLHVAAPFFGHSLGGLNLLTKRYQDTALSVFPAVHGDATDIPLKQLAVAYKRAKVSRLSVSAKRKDAFAHLKLYGIATKDESAWIFCTSANCTEAAWSGPNVEAGILRPVPLSNLSGYFVADKKELPHETITYKQHGTSDGALNIWASDDGSRVEIVVADRCTDQLPLRDATITVRSGSGLAVCHRPVLFQDGRFARIDWAAFPEWNRRKKMAVCLDVKGIASGGNRVRGQCFVENRLLLTADPVHRSAWRGALALLNEEGAPELADIAALFSLARDLFDGNLVRVPPTTPSADGETTKDGGAEPAAVAVWPPEADFRELQKRIGSTAVGHVQWFQRILQTLLQNEKSESNTGGPVNAGALDGDEEEPENDARHAEEKTRNENVAERIWLKAKKDYDSLYERLFSLVPTANNAVNIWPAAVFAFLSTMAVLRAVKRMAPGIDLGINAGNLGDDFVSLMLSERRQDDDFCCPKGYRYRSEKFPPLADDLRNAFKVHLHFELTNVMLTLIADQKMRTPGGLTSQFGQRYVAQICGLGYTADANAVDACRRIWRRYVVDSARKETDADFVAVLQLSGVPGFGGTSV